MTMAGGLPVLTYHAIDAQPGVTTTDPAWFVETLDALAEAGFRSVNLDDWVARGRPEVERGFALTFDDGLRSILRVVDPMLRRGFTATVFLVTDRVGGDNAWPGQPRWVPRAPLLTWAEADALHALGFRFGAHGRSHVSLARCDDVLLDDELRGSRDAIEDRLGVPCRLLAYPYGDAPARVRRAAAHHYAAALGTRLALTNAGQDRADLARVDACYLRSRHALDRLLSGRCGAWLGTRRVFREVRQAIGSLPAMVAPRHALSAGLAI
jgi:peptidoglycan/xylan/chitin deacetylase (PgdA/CDA1 family)